VSVEQLLEDSFVVFKGVIYLVGNRPRQSPITGTVGGLKHVLFVREVRRCDIAGRRDILSVVAGFEAARPVKDGKMAIPILGFQIW
jgi:hypothetical protein